VAKYQHVVPRDGKWVVKADGSQRASRVLATQAQAVEVARRIARNQGADVVIHELNGESCEMDSYGNDLFPPRNGVR